MEAARTPHGGVDCQVFTLGRGGLEPVKHVELEIGQVIWLNNPQGEGRRAVIFKQTERGYKSVGLKDYRVRSHTSYDIRPESEIFGIGWYYNPEEGVGPEVIEECLSHVEEVLKEDERKKAEAKAAQLAATEKCKEEYKHLRRPGPGEYADRVLGAKNIRQELKAAFPGQKFSVRGESFSGGDSIHISWTDGPTVDEVDPITKKYQQGKFNGMDDSYSYGGGPFTGLFGGAKYVSCDRNYTQEFMAEVAATLEGYTDGNEYWKDNRVNREAYKTSRYMRPEVHEVRTGGQTSPDGVQMVLNEDKNGVELYFPGKPHQIILDQLRALKFRWHRREKFWYAKQTPERIRLAEELSGGDTVEP